MGRKLAAALLDESKLAELETDPSWTVVQAIPINAPWPDEPVAAVDGNLSFGVVSSIIIMIGIAEDVPAAQKHICNKQQWELPNRLTHPQSHGGSLPRHPHHPTGSCHTQQGQIPLPTPSALMPTGQTSARVSPSPRRHRPPHQVPRPARSDQFRDGLAFPSTRCCGRPAKSFTVVVATSMPRIVVKGRKDLGKVTGRSTASPPRRSVAPMTCPVFMPPRGHQGHGDAGPVIPADLVADLRGAAEFPPDEDGGVLGETALVEVVDEGGDGLVEDGEILVLALEDLVPLAAVPVHLL